MGQAVNHDMQNELAAEILFLLGGEREGLSSQELFERSRLSEDQAEMRRLLHNMVNRKLLTRVRYKAAWVYKRHHKKQESTIPNRSGMIAGMLAIALRQIKTADNLHRREKEADSEMLGALTEAARCTESAFNIAKNISRGIKPSVGLR